MPERREEDMGEFIPVPTKPLIQVIPTDEGIERGSPNDGLRSLLA